MSDSYECNSHTSGMRLQSYYDRKMYFLNYIPFTFDEIPSVAMDDPEVVMEANKVTLLHANNYRSALILQRNLQ